MAIFFYFNELKDSDDSNSQG